MAGLHPEVMARDREGSEIAASLREVLHETKIWCATHGDARQPRTSLRSRETQPPEGTDWTYAVLFVAAARRKQGAGSMNTSVGDGRIVVYSPGDNLFDGAAEVASDGYFDVNNTPPWDTWLAVLSPGASGGRHSHLLAWVPPAMMHVAAKGINANPERCIRWLEDSDLAVRRLVYLSSG